MKELVIMNSIRFYSLAIIVTLLQTRNLMALPLDDYQPHFSHDEFYSEQWSASVWAENGYYVHIQFVISNIGIGDNKGAVKVEVTTPGGIRSRAKDSVGSDWNAQKTKFALKFGRAQFEMRNDGMFVSGGNQCVNGGRKVRRRKWRRKSAAPLKTAPNLGVNL